MTAASLNTVIPQIAQSQHLLGVGDNIAVRNHAALWKAGCPTAVIEGDDAGLPGTLDRCHVLKLN